MQTQRPFETEGQYSERFQRENQVLGEWLSSIPPEFKKEPVRTLDIDSLKGRVSYFAWFAEHGYTLKMRSAYKRKLDEAQEALRLVHECACCGILLTETQDSVGPECAKHPARFPCNAHRGMGVN
ncbi:MAG: hypothetical protein ABSF82_03470 [Candidatus Bathyarchaeia archaeon]|jgi:hypothetical protein